MTDTADYSEEADPTAHDSMHEYGGSGEISVQDLSGVLANPQPSTFPLVTNLQSFYNSLRPQLWITNRSSADVSWRCICWSPELSLFCAVASSGTNNRVMTSPNGINWTTRTPASNNDWRSVCWSPELTLFCAVSYTGTLTRVMTSPNGIDWTTRVNSVDNNWISVCWSPELTLFCAVSASGTTNRVMTSPNGIDWRAC